MADKTERSGLAATLHRRASEPCEHHRSRCSDRGQARRGDRPRDLGLIRRGNTIEGLVWMHPGSRFTGELATTDLVIEGELRGTVRATGKVDMRTTCRVEGRCHRNQGRRRRGQPHRRPDHGLGRPTRSWLLRAAGAVAPAVSIDRVGEAVTEAESDTWESRTSGDCAESRHAAAARQSPCRLPRRRLPGSPGERARANSVVEPRSHRDHAVARRWVARATEAGR